jgi:hypothetical protein
VYQVGFNASLVPNEADVLGIDSIGGIAAVGFRSAASGRGLRTSALYAGHAVVLLLVDEELQAAATPTAMSVTNPAPRKRRIRWYPFIWLPSCARVAAQTAAPVYLLPAYVAGIETPLDRPVYGKGAKTLRRELARLR